MWIIGRQFNDLHAWKNLPQPLMDAIAHKQIADVAGKGYVVVNNHAVRKKEGVSGSRISGPSTKNGMATTNASGLSGRAAALRNAATTPKPGI
jgi:hypothetical protein